MNTDIKSLLRVRGKLNTYLIGKQTLKGFGTGGNANIGKLAIEEDKTKINSILENTDILFLIAGLGKGTGSGCTPVIAQIAKEKGIPVISIVCLPSISVEGSKVYSNSLESYENIKNTSDSLCTIANDKIISSGKDSFFLNELEKGNSEILSLFSDFEETISSIGHINVDFNDFNTFFKENKFFAHINFKISSNYTYSEMQGIFKEKVENCFTNIAFSKKYISVIVNFKFSSKANTSVVKDVKKILEDFSANGNIKLVYGLEEMNGENEENEIAIFISNEEQKFSENENKYIPNQRQEAREKATESTTSSFTDLFDDDYEKTDKKDIVLDQQKIVKKLFEIDEEENDPNVTDVPTGIIEE
jgi:cell division protein FtsZ